MKRILLACSLLALGALAVLLAQPAAHRGLTDYPAWELKTVLPREISPARYQQVEPWLLESAARDGWELVGVTPYVYQNEERGPDGRKQVVTQTYPAYYFKRLRRER
jgi:hypothetical protein